MLLWGLDRNKISSRFEISFIANYSSIKFYFFKVARMLSKTVLKWIRHRILFASFLHVISRNWNPTTQRFKSQEPGRHVIGGNLEKILDVLCRLWCKIAYGWMTYNYSKNESTIIQVLFPAGFFCAMATCWNGKYASDRYCVENEQFLNRFFNLNNYLGVVVILKLLNVTQFIYFFSSRA